ncbi:rhomboid family intramembrane serine protease [Agrococcus sp. HG114]|uniref:rhomboid family intramembrane serine protease n=1 Tax=Agrococcus sp. HG114 TaxID=2969757 RepID=UPI00215B00C6|nr:rhomboid family intramembrane serine protease [Agrococcus sp. HG114]MCR8671239.1 rhomboid family intramembrane serine protease [Agrococcus sp. HG114]
MSSSAPADRCYRHPDRVSWVLCQRCGRTVCGECQQPAPVGVRCPECVRELAAEQRTLQRQARAATGAPRTELGRRARRWFAQPAPVTMSILAVTVAVGALQLLPGDLTAAMLYFLPYSLVEPWRFLSYALVHVGVLHLGINMLILWMVGPSIEQRIGRLPFLAAYLVSAAGAAVAIAWLTPLSPVVGASGAIYALFGMLIGMQRMLGTLQRSLLIVVGINLVLTFVISSISWSAHVGGLAIGLALGFGIGAVHTRMRGDQAAKAAWLVIGAVALVLALLFAARVASIL